MIKSILIRIGILLIGILIVTVGRGLFFYSEYSSLLPSEAPYIAPIYENVVVTTAPSTDFTDVYEKGEGVILIDMAHDNVFSQEELNVLILRLVSRGLSIKFFDSGDDLEIELLGEEEEEEIAEEPIEEEPIDEEEEIVEEPTGEAESSEEEEMAEEPTGEAGSSEEAVSEEPLEEEPIDEEEEVSGADAFIIVCNRSEFSGEEIKIIEEFVSDGGKLLLIGDPTRPNEMNSLALKFGLLFESDYLYNMIENEINYRNIFITEFEENEITKNLEKIVLYTAGSISSANSSIASVDGNTFSNVIETRTKLSPIALAQEAKVLAIHDLTFITEPYNGIFDNNRLISNVADWLMPTDEEMESK
ncbi:hypothetical protein ACFLU1_02580 [Chloroflexota bacterium]